MNLEQQLRMAIENCKFEQGITSKDCMLINGCASFYTKTKDSNILNNIVRFVEERMSADGAELMKLGHALRFLYEETKEEKYKDSIAKIIDYIQTAKRENGILVHEDNTMLTAMEAFDLMPVYAWYETNFNKKEHYIDIMNQLTYLNDQMLVKNTIELNDRCTFMMALADTAVSMSEEIYEYYAQIKSWLKEAVHNKLHVVNNDCLRVAYSIRKGCECKALLPEKYEEIGLNMFEQAAEKLLSSESIDKAELGILLMTYALV